MNNYIEYGFRRWFVTLTVMICMALAVFNYAGVDVAGNDISGNLGGNLHTVGWITTTYILGALLIVPFSRWLSSRLGRRNYLGGAVIFFTVCSFFCGNAGGMGMLMVCRFLQGVGAGVMMVSSMMILMESWPGEKRGVPLVLGLVSIGIGWGLGKPVGGYITDEFSWVYVFLVNIPLGVIAGVMVFLFVRNGGGK